MLDLKPHRIGGGFESHVNMFKVPFDIQLVYTLERKVHGSVFPEVQYINSLNVKYFFSPTPESWF